MLWVSQLASRNWRHIYCIVNGITYLISKGSTAFDEHRTHRGFFTQAVSDTLIVTRQAASKGGIPMDTRTDEQRAYIEALLNRLRRLYVERAEMPGEGEILSFEVLQKLCRHVVSEGYGE